MSFSKLDYCQYLLSSQTNFTLTHLAEHLQTFSHDTINRYLREEKLTPRLLWEQVKPLIVSNPDGYLLFDDQLYWSATEAKSGKLIKLRGFPKDKKVKLFRVIVSTDKTEYVVTNDLSQDSTNDTQKVCAVRWKIEQFHREVKQTTGIEACQCRKQRIQRNHIACALLVWTRLRQLAEAMGTTVYQLKMRLLSNYLIEQLKSPTLPMRLNSATTYI